MPPVENNIFDTFPLSFFHTNTRNTVAAKEALPGTTFFIHQFIQFHASIGLFHWA
jgi:hypothetical protein